VSQEKLHQPEKKLEEPPELVYVIILSYALLWQDYVGQTFRFAEGI